MKRFMKIRRKPEKVNGYFVENDVLSTAFCYARNVLGLEKRTYFGMRISLNLPSLATKYLILEEMKTVNLFIIIAIHSCQFLYVIQLREVDLMLLTNILNLKLAMGFLFHIKKKIVNCNICDFLEGYFELFNKHEKLQAKEFDSKYEVDRDNIQKEKADKINNKPHMLPIQQELSELNLNKTQM